MEDEKRADTGFMEKVRALVGVSNPKTSTSALPLQGEATSASSVGVPLLPPVTEGTAATFPTKPISVLADDQPTAFVALQRIREGMADIFLRATGKVDSGELPLIGWGLTQPRVQKLSPEHEQKQWYFIGDLHNDFFAWHYLFERVRREKDFRLCFLGDLVDRGPHHLECFAALLEAAEHYPDQILWILGNHDDGVQYHPGKENKFFSTVIPSEFADWLNGRPEGFAAKDLENWGRLFVDVCRRLPRAVLFSDGLLATHGGVPLPDRWETLKTMEAFHHQKTMADFTWSRAGAKSIAAGWKYDPARRATSSAFEYGYKDLEGFCKAVEGIFSVKRMIRGHDHVANGAEVMTEYKLIPVLTLNGFGFDYLSNSVAKYRPDLTLGVSISGDLPRVESVGYPIEDYSSVYPRKPDVANE